MIKMFKFLFKASLAKVVWISAPGEETVCYESFLGSQNKIFLKEKNSNISIWTWGPTWASAVWCSQIPRVNTNIIRHTLVGSGAYRPPSRDLSVVVLRLRVFWLTWHEEDHVHPEWGSHSEEEEECGAESAVGLPAAVSVEKLLQDPSDPALSDVSNLSPETPPITHMLHELQCKCRPGRSRYQWGTYTAGRRANSSPCGGWWGVSAVASQSYPDPGVSLSGSTTHSWTQLAIHQARASDLLLKTSFSVTVFVCWADWVPHRLIIIMLW